MKKKIKLATPFVEYLTDLPEQGMGYQLVEVTLQNGQILKNRAVMNSTYLMLDDNEEITAEEIKSIKLETKKN